VIPTCVETIFPSWAELSPYTLRMATDWAVVLQQPLEEWLVQQKALGICIEVHMCIFAYLHVYLCGNFTLIGAKWVTQVSSCCESGSEGRADADSCRLHTAAKPWPLLNISEHRESPT
jgi:hypothetical protein